MIQDKIFFDEKDPTGVSYNTPFTVYGSYEGRLWSKTPSGTIKYYTQNSDLSVYATTGSNSFNGNQTVTGSLTVTGGITGSVTTASYVEYAGVANKPALVSSSAQIVGYNVFATTGSNQFNGSQAITGSLTVTGQVVAQTLNVQQVTSSIVYSSGSNVFGNSLGNTQQFTGSVSVTGSMAVAGVGANSGIRVGSTDGGRAFIRQSAGGDAEIGAITNGGLFLYANNTLGLSFTGAVATFASSVTTNNLGFIATNGYGITSYSGATASGDNIVFGAGVYNTFDGIYQSSGATRDFGIWLNGGTINNPKFVIKNGGNIGIGTTSPSSLLEVAGGGIFSLQLSGNLTNSTRKFAFIQGKHYTNSEEPIAMIGIDSQASTSTLYIGGGLSSELNAATEISFQTGATNTTLTGTERMNISSGGLVTVTGNGSGATSEGIFFKRTSNLAQGGYINGNGGVLQIVATDQHNSDNGAIYFQRYNGTTVSNSMIINSSGNVGIGTTSPNGRLQVSNGTLGLNLQAHVVNITGNNYSSATIGIYDAASLAANTGGGINFGAFYTSTQFTEFAYIRTNKDTATSGEYGGSLIFATRPNGGSVTERMRITSGGVVLINNTLASPYGVLNTFKTPVSSTYVDQIVVQGTGNYPSLRLGTYDAYDGVIATTGNDLRILAGLDVYTENHSIRFYTSFIGGTGGAQAYERMRIESDGVVQVRSGNELRAYRPDNARYGTFYTDNNNVVIAASVDPITLSSPERIVFSTASTERMRITSGGYLKVSSNGVYIDSSGPYHEIVTAANNTDLLFMRHTAASPYGAEIQFSAASPNNSSNWFAYYYDSTNVKFIVYSNGNVVNRNGSYGTISDIKYKENIVDATPKLDDILKLQVRNFNLIGDDKKQIGFIAQEFEEVFPSMVDISIDKNTEEEYKSIKTTVLIPMLVKAIQELKSENDTLKSILQRNNIS